MEGRNSSQRATATGAKFNLITRLRRRSHSRTKSEGEGPNLPLPLLPSLPPVSHRDPQPPNWRPRPRPCPLPPPPLRPFLFPLVIYEYICGIKREVAVQMKGGVTLTRSRSQDGFALGVKWS